MFTLGPYEIEAPVARGSVGQVWRGHHRGDGLAIAVKVLAHDGWSPRRCEQLRNEARAAAAFDHPNIALVVDFGEVPADVARASRGAVGTGWPWIAMEYVGGGTLDAIAPTLDWPGLRHALHGILDGLAHAHARGVVHRDVKPGNVLLDAVTGRYKLVDFGIAHVLGEALDASARSGTPSVMAPEQFEGRWRDFGPWTDLYAVGALAWRAATGTRLFGGSAHDGSSRSAQRHWTAAYQASLARPLPPFQPRFAVPDGLLAWIERLLDPNPLRRFRTSADAARALAALDTPAPDPALFPTHRTEEPRIKPVAGLGVWGLRQLPLVGRFPHRDLLWTALGRVRATGRPEVVLVRGSSGVGKTRLATWLAERSTELGVAQALHVTHDPASGASGLAGLLVRHLVAGGLAADELHARLHAAADRLGVSDSAAWLVRTLTTTGDPLPERLAGWRHYLGALARERPVVLILDDLHAGPEAVGLARVLAGAPAPGSPGPADQAPVLVLAVVEEEALAERPDVATAIDALGGDPACTTLEVGPLDDAERVALLRELLGLAPDLAASIGGRTGGNPLFAVQLVGEQIAAGRLSPGPDGFALPAGVAPALPASLREVWAQRLERVLAGHPADEVRSLEIAAVLGREVDGAEWVAACAGAGVAPAPRLVEELVGVRLATSVDPAAGFAFAHGMLRETVILRVPAEALPDLHRACAVAVRGPGSDGRRGRHLARAGDPAAAIDPLLAGAERLQTGVGLEAFELATEALAACEAAGVPASDPRRAAARLVRVRILIGRGRFDEAEAEARAIRADADQYGWTGVECRAHTLQAMVALTRWQLREARALFLGARAAAEQAGDLATAWTASRGLVTTALYTGELALAATELDRVRRTMPPDLGPDAWGGVEMLEGTLAGAQRDLERARKHLAASVEQFRRGDHRFGRAAALGGLAAVHRETGDIDGAEAMYREALSVAIASGSDMRSPLALGLALCTAARGELPAAIAALQVERALLERRGSIGHVARADGYLFACLALHGDPEAEFVLDRFDDETARSHAVHTDVALYVERAAVAAADAGRPYASRALRTASALWVRLGNADEADRLRLLAAAVPPPEPSGGGPPGRPPRTPKPDTSRSPSAAENRIRESR